MVEIEQLSLYNKEAIEEEEEEEVIL